jgi:hypothetical protein
LGSVLILTLIGCNKIQQEKLINRRNIIEESKKEDAKLSTQELDKKYSILLGQVVEFSGAKEKPIGIGIKSLLVYPASSLEEQFAQLPRCETKKYELMSKQNVRMMCLRSEIIANKFKSFDPQPPYTIKPIQP